MLPLQEKLLLGDGALLEIELGAGGAHRLRYGVLRYGGALVEYANGRRRVRGRELPYEFRSVEQLRYDFERDVEAIGGGLGEDA